MRNRDSGYRSNRRSLESIETEINALVSEQAILAKKIKETGFTKGKVWVKETSRDLRDIGYLLVELKEERDALEERRRSL
jgi:hypothetical protein